MCVPRPVGTRGGVEWMRGPCACPGWAATCWLHAVPKESRCHQDKHKAPTLPHIRPLSLQDPGMHAVPKESRCHYRTLGCKSLHGYDYPIRSSTFIRLSHLVDCLQTIHTSPGVLSTPHFVPWRKVTGRCLTP